MRKLPPRSLPVASQTSPLARAAPEPPEEPPALFRISQGLRVKPLTGLKVWPPAHSGTFDFATAMAPLLSSFLTVASDFFATLFANIGEP